MFAELRLKNFRSYQDDSFEFSPGVNIIVGPNASGKTNLLEAILVSARGSSYRAKDTELVRFEAPWARLDARLTSGSQRIVKLVAEPSPGKSYDIDGKPFKRLTLNHSLPVVLFEPNHLQMLSGGPQRRRDYLDDILEQITPGYGTLRRQYKRTLAQRNSLLKRGGADLHTQLFPWNVRLSQLAGQIVRSRADLVAKMQESLPVLYQELSGTSTSVGITYGSVASVDTYESHLLRRLESSTELDRLRGFTAAGPHREDLVAEFDGHPAQEAASRGESRTMVLALKMLELQAIETARGMQPVLLLDDVFSELDSKRRHALTNFLSDYQAFITTTDADVITKNFIQKSNLIAMSPRITG